MAHACLRSPVASDAEKTLERVPEVGREDRIDQWIQTSNNDQDTFSISRNLVIVIIAQSIHNEEDSNFLTN